MSEEKIKPFIPIWNKGKNVFQRFEVRDFDDGVGHKAKVTYAIFIDKDKKLREEVAFVKWEQN